jgi:hypothetical protein
VRSVKKELREESIQKMLTFQLSSLYKKPHTVILPTVLYDQSYMEGRT